MIADRAAPDQRLALGQARDQNADETADKRRNKDRPEPGERCVGQKSPEAIVMAIRQAGMNGAAAS